ncbi:hypothetical protein H4R19_001741, partial [Coemansia spiralis]
ASAVPSPPHNHQRQLAAPDYPRYAPSARSGPGPSERAPWHPPPLGPPPPQSHAPPGPGLRSFNLPPPPPPPQHHPMRLPPMELAPTRRHSLAVTSHLERYRAQDATPPPQLTPPQHQQQQPQSAKPPPPELSPMAAVTPATAAPRLTLPGPAPSPQSQQPAKPLYLRQQQPMEPLPEDREPVLLHPAPAPPVESDRSRRGSHEGVAPPASDTRRASIIALTNPQSEEDVRAENAELKRRLDDMEAKYLAEVARLVKAVRELEVEKTMLKSMLLEKGASKPPSPMPHSAPDMFRTFSMASDKSPARK